MELAVTIERRGSTNLYLRYRVIAYHSETGELYVNEKNSFTSLGRAKKFATRLSKKSNYHPVEIQGYWISKEEMVD